MKKRTLTFQSRLFASALTSVLLVPGVARAQKTFPLPPKLKGYHLVIPWAGGRAGARVASSPIMSTISFTATKDNAAYSATIIGTNPFSPTLTSQTINVAVVPVIVVIGTTTFDPTANDVCDGNVPALTRFQNSPLVISSNLTFNGVNVGNTQFINGFRRAEFWDAIHGTKGSAYQNPLRFKILPTLTINSGAHGGVGTTPSCPLGFVSNPWLDAQLRAAIPTLTGVPPNSLVLFLFRNVVQSITDPPTVSPGACCILGYHSAFGTAPQTYAAIDWNTVGSFGLGVQDGSVASHELAEWMDDPLGTNPTPPWGRVGQVTGCQSNWEAGDPLSNTAALVPITLGGTTYHVQELAYFSFFFNSPTTGSGGATRFVRLANITNVMGGDFSSNGFFKGPANACLPGGVAKFVGLTMAQPGR